MEIKIPTLINDIKLSEWQKWESINNEGQDDDFLTFKMIESFCGIDIALVSKFPMVEAKQIAEEIGAVLYQKTTFVDRFELNGVEYGFIPKLEAITLGEYIDLETFLSDPKEFHKAMSVLYRPIKKKFGKLYTIKPYEANSEQWEVMKDAPLGIVSSAVVFFYHIAEELSMDFQISFQKGKMKGLTIPQKANLHRAMGGLIPFMRLPEGMSPNSNQSQNKI